jgi:hypothetical protein
MPRVHGGKQPLCKFILCHSRCPEHSSLWHRPRGVQESAQWGPVRAAWPLMLMLYWHTGDPECDAMLEARVLAIICNLCVSCSPCSLKLMFGLHHQQQRMSREGRLHCPAATLTKEPRPCYAAINTPARTSAVPAEIEKESARAALALPVLGPLQNPARVLHSSGSLNSQPVGISSWT